MRSKQSTFMLMITAVITAVFLATSGAHAFWYGETESLHANLGEVAEAGFVTCLEVEVFPFMEKDIDRTNLQEDWYSRLDSIVEELSSGGKDALNQCLTTYILAELDEKLEFNDNRGGDEGVTINQKEAFNGYTLLSSMMGHGCDKVSPVGAPTFPVVDEEDKQIFTNTCGAILIDMDGNIVKEWPLVAVPAKMLPDGNVLGMAMTFSNGPPIGGLQSMMQMDWCGNETWRWPQSPYPVFPVFGGARAHHDFQREGNPVGYFVPGQEPSLVSGKNLVLSNIVSPNPPFPPLIVPEISQFELLEDAIYEVDVNGDISWEWYSYQHFDQMGFKKTAMDAIRNISVAGIGGIPGGGGPTDWQHLNSASYVGPNKWYDEKKKNTWIFHPENIIYDSRTSNYLAIIARVDHPKDKWKVGDIVWRVGPHYPTDDKEGKVDQIIGPHMAHMIPQGLPGEGNILVFDNGGLAGYGSLLPGLPGTYPATLRDYSRVIEFNPKSLEVVWEYKCPDTITRSDGTLERRFYSRLISGAQRLENGNTLITEGVNGRIFEVNVQGDVVWEYIHKTEYANGAFGLLPFLPSTAIYRAYRVPAAWVPNDRTCE